MTKAPPLRASSRITSQKKKTAAVAKAPTKQQASIRKMKKKIIGKGSVVSIYDFKNQSGKTMYLVERDGPNEDIWETEDMIESLNVLTEYQQKIQAESGYSITTEDQQGHQRSSRASKTRAVIALKQPDYAQDADGDDNQSGVATHKSTKKYNSTRKPFNNKSTRGRKTKAQALLDNQLEERLDRKKMRINLDPEEIICNLDHLDGKNCCLQCGVNTYREALERNDLNGLRAALNDKGIPHHSSEDKPNGLDFIQYAIVLQREEFADVLEKHYKTANMADYPELPSKYTKYDGGNTGRNSRIGEYHSRSFRRVEESRGNRVGNSAFYRDQNSNRTFMNLENQIQGSSLHSFMSYISKDAFRDKKVIDNYLVHFNNGSYDVYYAVASGSRRLAKSLLAHVNSTERSTFNHLHDEVLKFENKEPLTSYRRPQVLKMASDAFNVTPYHIAAINPSASYLSELFEALDPAERLQTDALGRSVAFYAAVSETSDCLEFLESKGFNLSLVDKYKMSPLIQAARFGRSHNVEILIKHLRGGPEVTTTSPFVFQTSVRNRRTALHYAAFFGHAETCNILIKYDSPIECVENLNKQTPLIYAAKNGNVDCVRILIEEGKANPEKGDKFSRTALHYACMNGHMDVVKYLLSQGVNANASDSSNNSPVHFAAAFGYLKILHLLIEFGSADPSACNVWRSTPCSIANMKGHIGIVKYLLGIPHSSIDVNFKDQSGCIMLQHTINESVATPLEKKINIEKVTLLLEMKADINSINLEGETSLHTLVSDTTYAKYLPKGWEMFYSGANAYYQTEEIKYDNMEGVEYQKTLAKLLINRGADLNIKSSINETPLATAMRLGNHHLVAMLIEAGAKFWIDTDEKGNNFFHYFGNYAAFINGLQPHYDLDVLVKERHEDIAKRVWASVDLNSISHMLDIEKIINLRNNEGYTPLYFGVACAIKDQKAAMVREKQLIQAGVSEVFNDSSSYFGGGFNSYQNNNSNKRYPSKMFGQATLPVDVNLQFNFKLWVKLMSDMVTRLKPNMNEAVDLPKDFKKNNPTAKRSDYPTSTGYTALHLAAETQCVDLIQFLLENGSEPNMKVKLDGKIMLSGDTPMIIAYRYKKDRHQEVPDQSLESTEKIKKGFVITKPNFKKMLYQTVKTLIQFKACPFIKNASGNSAVLKASASLDNKNLAQMCSIRPSKYTDINGKNEKDESALMIAVEAISFIITTTDKEPNINSIEHLLKAGANPNMKYENGDTVLIKIVKTSHVLLLETLFQHSTVIIDHNIQNKKLENALMIACKLNVPGVVLSYIQYLRNPLILCELSVLDGVNNSALSYAARNGNAQVVNELLLLGANPNFNSAQHVPLIEATSSQNIDIVELILKHGARVNEQDEIYGNSALHVAILTEKHRIVKLLLDNGADFDLPNLRKQTPMHLSVETTCKQTNRSYRAERLLMKAGANVNAVDFFGRTPLHYVFVKSDLIPITRHTVILAKKVQQIAKELKAKEGRIKALSDYAHMFDLGKFSEDSSTNIDYLNIWMKSAKETQLDHAEIEKKQNHKKHEEDHITVLEEEKDALKIYYGNQWEVDMVYPARFDPIDIIKFLSDFEGLQLDIKDVFGRTPLHYAACVGAFSCTSLLIENKVNINAVDSDNNGALQLALRNNYVDYSVMLCNFGATVNNGIVLKDGKSTSTFSFSLSQSLINMAYLIMDRGATLIESIRDTLINGKFHMAEILLQSAQDEALSETLLAEGQNIWHIISDFKPFNDEIWEDYVEDIIERLLTLNLPICNDIYNRSPIHYAAKHGQTLLLRRLLSMAESQIQNIDKDGNSAIDYAVDSKKFDSVKELLNAGASVSNTNGFQKESLVLKSVQSESYSITEILLQYSSPVNEDSSYGRISAVMAACQKKDLKVLNLLISKGADLNKPCHVERKDNTGKKYTVLLHPIFAASYNGSLLLEVMLKAGANPNVNGPDSKPEYGRSCFMYNVALDSIENQQTLLKYNIDLNSIDSKSSRTIFYQFFFGKMRYNQKYKDTSSIDDRKLNFNDAIYEKMIQSFNPEVNYIDRVTGMTPLELAIREKNIIIIERLLSLGADINIESCNTTTDFVSSNIMNPSSKTFPAIVHAIIQNNLKVLSFLCKNAHNQMDWDWHDDEKRNVLSYIVGCNGGFSHENIGILEYVAGEMKTWTFKKLSNMRDIHGNSPIYYSYERKNKEMYEAMIRIEPTCEVSQYDKEPDNKDDSSMEIDFISTQKVDEDAQIERAILQKEKDLEKAKDKIPTHDDHNPVVKVDTYSNLEKVGYVMLDENNQAYDIMLIKVEISNYGLYTDTSFYKMSIIHNKVLNLNILWTRWGRYGDEGQHQKTPYLNLEEAVTEFKNIFKSKTVNSWNDHRTSFVQKQGRYDILKKSHHPKDNIIKDFDFLASTLPVQLPREITDVMELICNYTYLSRVYSDSHIDMPLGQVPQKTIEQARKILMDVQYMSKRRQEARSHYSDRAKISEAKAWEFKIAQKCVEYARLLPRSDEHNKPVRSLLDTENQNFKQELSRIEDLSYVGFAANVILAAKHHMNNTNPLQYIYQTLNCSLRNMKFSTNSSEYQMIKNYMQSTSNGNHELVHLLAVNRGDEENRFRPFEKESNRKLLWHGSRVGNFMGILKQGLRVSPRTSSFNGAMLGNGVYFADTFAKSLNYSNENYETYKSAYKLLLLCEVALGSKTAIFTDLQNSSKTEDLHSMKGEGSNIPDPDNVLHNENGVCVPMGPCIPFSRPITTNQGYLAPLLNHNEFAVYDENRIKIRYLLIIRESTSCFLCSKPDSNSLKPLFKHDVKKYNFTGFNSFEGEVTKAYLSHENISPQDIFEQGLDSFIESRIYKTKWNIPLDLCKESKVCYTCAQDVTTILLEKKMTSSNTDIPECLRMKPQCKYGKECRTQKSIAHAKKYQHWLNENISGENDEPITVKKVNDDIEYEDDSEMGSEDIVDSSMETETEDDEDYMDTDDE